MAKARTDSTPLSAVCETDLTCATRLRSGAGTNQPHRSSLFSTVSQVASIQNGGSRNTWELVNGKPDQHRKVVSRGAELLRVADAGNRYKTDPPQSEPSEYDKWQPPLWEHWFKCRPTSDRTGKSVKCRANKSTGDESSANRGIAPKHKMADSSLTLGGKSVPTSG